MSDTKTETGGPREFWIYENMYDGEDLVNVALTEPGDGLHVIEYSAYKEKQRELQSRYDSYRKTAIEVLGVERTKSQKLAEQNKKLVAALEFYTKRENFTLIFDDETGSRAEIYEKYKTHSIGDFSVKAIEALAEHKEQGE